MPPLAASGPNAEQIRYWNEQSGPRWVASEATARRADRAARPRGDGARARRRRRARARRRLRLRADDACSSPSGSGRAARSPASTSPRRCSSARGRARPSADSRTSRFVNADAQTAALGAAAFDLVFSRFGVMFFADPIAAFTNLRASLAPGGRVVFVCWQELARNPWMRVPLGRGGPHIPLHAAARARMRPAPSRSPIPRACAASSRPPAFATSRSTRFETRARRRRQRRQPRAGRRAHARAGTDGGRAARGGSRAAPARRRRRARGARAATRHPPA